ncbi:DUF1983 domain-containing protein [Leisingera sp. M658]|uniref:phage tail tip fiber protein n=1 Tax=Leisingera sp. M658 TaxID=2867015 RepID=UPI0021A6C695|nr:DUF1983 domain-containing protein [Leisingera sp. M658]UWQ75997.1 DUF1983 domain-containing protein [Leisingera sp. M658]
MKLLSYALLLLLVLCQPAEAASVGAVLVALGTAFKAYVAANAIAAFALRTLVSTGISLLLKKFQQRKQRRPGIQTSATTTGGTDPQGSVVGRFATAGHLVYQNSHGGNRVYLTHVIELGDLPGASLRRLIIDGEYSEIGTDWDPNVGYQILNKVADDGWGYGWIRFYDGSQLAADPRLVALYGADPDRSWTEDHILTGLNYAVLTFYRSDKQYPNGRPQVRFELNGPGFYDVRQDSTAGGNGPQRWDDQTTWQPTENLMAMAYTVMRGITLPCGSVWGGGFPAGDMPYTEWAAALDACDLGVGSNNRPQFRGGMEIRFEEPPADFLEEIFAAANAEIVELGGYWYPLVGSVDTYAADLTEDDLLVSEGWKHDPFPGLEKAFNAVTITHPSPNALWNPSAPVTLTRPEWEAEDGGERVFDLKLPMVFNTPQARQIGNALLKENRRFRTHRLPLPPEYSNLRPLQKTRFTSAWYGYEGKTFTITEMAFDLLKLNVSVSLREWDHSDFDPDLALETPDLPQVTAPIVTQDAGVPGFGVSGIEIKDANGIVRGVGIRAVWTPSLAFTADGVSFQVRVKDGDDERFSASTADLELGTFRLEPMQGGTEYEARGKAISKTRDTKWTAWLPVTTPAFKLQPDMLADETWQAISDDANAAAAALDDQLVLDKIAPLEGAVKRDLEIRDVQSFHAAEALGVIGDKVLWALTRLSEIDARMADAGIYQDPDTGTVRIYGVVAEAERISEAEIRLSAAEARISLTATEAYVNQQVSIALTDPSQFPVFEGLQVRVNQVEADLDAAEAAIALKATQTEVDGMDARLSSAEVDIDAAQEAITLKVDQADFDAAESRLSSAEVQISTLDGPAITQSVSDVRNLHDQMALQDVATLEQLLLAYEQREALKTQIAYATQDIRARVDDDRSATAAITASLGVAIENSVALIESEKLVRADATSALSQSYEQLSGRVESAEGDLTQVNKVDVSSTSALVQSHLNLEGAVNDPDTGLAAAHGEITQMNTVDVSSTSALVQSHLNLEGTVNDPDTGLAAAHGEITQLNTVDVSSGSALVQSHLNLEGTVNDPDTGLVAARGEITQLNTVDVSSTSALVQAHMALASEFEGKKTTIETTANTVDGVMGEYTLRIDNNGHVAGMVVRSELDEDDAPIARIAFQADMFAIVSPDGSNETVPFTLYTQERTINGRVYPAGAYMENAFLGAASIGRAEIADVIKSDDYAQDGNGIPTAGIKINFDTGRIKAAGVVLSRPMVLAQGSFTVSGAVGNGARWAFVNTGIRVGKLDVWQAQRFALAAAASVTTTGTAPGGMDPNNTFWTLNTSIQPGARWNGFGGANPAPAASWSKDPSALVDPHWASGSDQRVFLAIDLEAQGGVYFNNPKIEWTVFQVT